MFVQFELLDLFVVLIAGILVLGLQFVLSSRRNWLWGYILPLVSLGYSLYRLPQMDIFPGLSVNQKFYMYIGQNIPTFILLFIYFICRSGIKQRRKR